MATTDRPGKITPTRGVATGVLIVLGVFTLSASLGATSWILTALGIALIGGGITLALVSRFNPGAFTLTRRTTVALVPVGAQPVEGETPQGTSEVPRGAAPTEPSPGPLAVRPVPGTVPFIELDISPARPTRPTGDPRGERLTGGTPRPTRLTGTNALPGEGAHDNQAADDQEPRGDLQDGDLQDGDLRDGDLRDSVEPDDAVLTGDARVDATDASAEAGPGSASAGGPMPRPDAGTDAMTSGEPVVDGAAAGAAAAAEESAPVSATASGAAQADDAERRGEPEAGTRAAEPASGGGEPAPPAPGGAVSAVNGAAPQTQPRRRPSPRPRPPVDDTPRASLATGLTPYPLTLEAGDSTRHPSNPAPRPRPGETERPAAGLNGVDPTATAEPGGASAEVAESLARRSTAPRILRLIPARPAAVAMPGADSAGSEQISEAYQKVSPPPGEDAVDTEGTAELTVHNLGEAVEFYRDKLGLVQLDIGDKQAILQCGDAYVRLNVDRTRRVWRGALIHVMLEVEDVRAAYQSLLERGVRFVHEPRRVSRYHDLELWSAAFRDPDGHGLAVIRWDLPPEQSQR